MATLDEARKALATAVTSTGLKCQPYPPDSVNAPTAFVDSVLTDFTGSQPGGGYFCLPGLATATIVTLAQRNDRPGSMAYLEGFIPAVLEAIKALSGVRITSAASGAISFAGVEMPAVTYTLQFAT